MRAIEIIWPEDKPTSPAAAPGPVAEEVSAPVATVVGEARALRNKRRAADAIRLLDEVQGDSPLDQSELFLWEGKLHQDKKRIPDAICALDAAASRAQEVGNHAAKIRQLAYVEFQKAMALNEGTDRAAASAQFKKTEPYLQAAIDNESCYSLHVRCDMRHNLAFALEQGGQLAEAIKAYKYLIPMRLQAGLPSPLGYTCARLGDALNRIGALSEAITYLEIGTPLIYNHGPLKQATKYANLLKQLYAKAERRPHKYGAANRGFQPKLVVNAIPAPGEGSKRFGGSDRAGPSNA